MPALPPFAAAEQRVNLAVMARLSNALASLAGGAQVEAIYDREYVLATVGHDGLAATAPAITVPTANVPAGPVGQSVTVVANDGTNHWRIAEHHPDGAGLSVLLLERAA